MERKRIGHGVWVFRSRFADMLSTVISLGEGMCLLVDPPFYPGEAAAVRDFARREGMEVEWVVFTHAHGDHIYGTIHFPEAVTVAHERFWPFWQGIAEEDRAFFAQYVPDFSPPPVRPPNLWVGERTKLLFRRELLLCHAPGHSPDGIMVELPREGIWIAGDTVIPVPLISSGSIRELRRTLEDLRARWRGETIVPGHGEILEGEAARGALARNLEYLEILEKTVAEALEAGKGLPELEAMPLERFGIAPGEVGGLAGWIHRENLRRAYGELSGKG